MHQEQRRIYGNTVAFKVADGIEMHGIEMVCALLGQGWPTCQRPIATIFHAAAKSHLRHAGTNTQKSSVYF